MCQNLGICCVNSLLHKYQWKIFEDIVQMHLIHGLLSHVIYFEYPNPDIDTYSKISVYVEIITILNMEFIHKQRLKISLFCEIKIKFTRLFCY